ncbi:hypothetical protein E0Z10_g2430 [Xylaria hypoxylon]|uniref:Carboxylesterase type B domain-containing protein n=1 Tax=Xylaria hypoxylon TaxID=37992 RepID=A0A4Z0YR00_9PEZI|nr:hypothetical protein E0Z10_g2430 [Xylaria hypoxylon]
MRPLLWTGVRLDDRHGLGTFQPPPPAALLYFGWETEFSHDCLYLNVCTGATGPIDKPVQDWYHFEVFVFGSGSNPLQDGIKLATECIIVVTVNSRLGRSGFFALPEMNVESGHQASCNYGIMDQIAALEWVQRGVSSGGSNVHIFRNSPLAKGLFCKATYESVPGMTPVINGPGHITAYMTMTAADEAGTESLDVLDASFLAELPGFPSEMILGASLARRQGPWKSYLRLTFTSLSVYDTTSSIVDDYVLAGQLTPPFSGQRRQPRGRAAASKSHS